VKKFNRFLLSGLGTLCGLAAVLLLGVNLYVQSQATQARIQQELGQRLGTELHIRRISVTPWGGLRLSGITIPQENTNGAENFLEAKTFSLRIRFSSLFSQPLVIKEVSLIQPNVVWKQNADGKWRLPENFPPPKQTSHREQPSMPSASPFPSRTSAEIAAQVTAIPKQQPASVQPSTGVQTMEPFVPEVRRVSLSKGAFHFLDEDGNPVAIFAGVNFRSNLRNASALRGTIAIARTSLRDRFFLEQLQSPLQYDPRILDFSHIAAKAAGGDIFGRFSMHPQQKDSPFTVHVDFRGLQADRLITEAGGTGGIVQGRLEGFLDAAGKTADPNALNGQGEIYLRGGEVQQYSLLIALGQMLQIEELTRLHLDDAHVKYHLTPGLVTIDELLLRSPNIRLSATGTITFAGKMRLESQLALNEKIRGQLFRAIQENFQPTNEPGFSAVAFQVTGTVDRPKTNLMDKLVGQDLKDLGNVLSSLFGGGKSDSKKKKRSSQAAPESSVSPTPTERATVTSPSPSPSVAAPSGTP